MGRLDGAIHLRTALRSDVWSAGRPSSVATMVADNRDPKQTAYTVTVDAAVGVTTGISAADRARTLRVLADPATKAGDLTRPGHVLPLRARSGGVLARRGHTEAAVDLCTLAGLPAVGVIAELVEDDGSMKRMAGIEDLGARHDLPVLTIEELANYRRAHPLPSDAHPESRIERADEDSDADPVRHVSGCRLSRPGYRRRPSRVDLG